MYYHASVTHVVVAITGVSVVVEMKNIDSSRRRRPRVLAMRDE